MSLVEPSGSGWRRKKRSLYGDFIGKEILSQLEIPTGISNRDKKTNLSWLVVKSRLETSTGTKASAFCPGWKKPQPFVLVGITNPE